METITKITDILEQIQSVDEMIVLHQQKEEEQDIMLIQYQYRRVEYISKDYRQI